MTDDELLLSFRASGDNLWLGYLLQRYTALLFGVGLKYLKDKDLAEDAVQQVFLKALTHLPAGEILNFKGWLYILMRNHCFQVLRDKPHHTVPDALGNVAGSDEQAQEEAAWENRTLEQMEGAIEELHEEQRVCIVLFYLKKQSYQQITDHTGYTFVQVKSYIQNGKRNLKTILLKKTGR